jgi:superfamily II DNA or RNA helicase
MLALRPRQHQLIDDIRAGLRQHRTLLAVAPTGFGKTVVFSYLADAVQAKGKRVYIVVHRDELVDQVSRTLQGFGVEHGFIAAGRQCIPHPVMVASVFTLANRLDHHHPPDLLIVDEAHHAASGSTWGRVMTHWPTAYILGVTATPIRLDGRDLSGSFQGMVEGPTVAQLIADLSLCKYRMFTPPVVLGQLRMRMGDYVKSDLAAAVDKPSVTGDAVEHYRRLASGKRALVFCVSLEHAEHVRDQFRSAGYASERIDGGLDREERRRLVRGFTAGAIQVLTSCDLISEGFDLPAIEVAILLRPTASLGLYLQQVGRALRTHPGKESALILDHAGNAGRHGLPDDDREWSLGEDQTKRGKRKKLITTVRTCGKCFAAARPGALVCVECGFTWPVESREVQHIKGELHEVDSDLARAKIEARREVGMSKSLDALKQLEIQRGYRPGWAHHVWSSRAASRR